MSKKILVVLVILLVIIAGTVAYVYFGKNDEKTTTWIVPEVLEPYIKIQKNEELSSTDLTLNGSNTEMYYYFDVFNFDEETSEYNDLDLVPYVKLDLQSEIQNLITINLYYIKDITVELSPENMEEITTKGETGTDFENYFECKKINKYNKEKEDENIAHYVAKITLNTEAQEYIDFTGTVDQKLDMVFGYKQYTK